jgi:hypothetical protein
MEGSPLPESPLTGLREGSPLMDEGGDGGSSAGAASASPALAPADKKPKLKFGQGLKFGMGLASAL